MWLTHSASLNVKEEMNQKKKSTDIFLQLLALRCHQVLIGAQNGPYHSLSFGRGRNGVPRSGHSQGPRVSYRCSPIHGYSLCQTIEALDALCPGNVMA